MSITLGQRRKEYVVKGTNSAADNSAIASAVSQLNAAGSGSLVIDGTVKITGSHRFTAPISLRWPNGTINVDHSGSDTFIWEPSANWNPFSLSTKTVTPMTTNFGATVVVSDASGLAQGDWFAIWADDGLTIDPTFPSVPHDVGTDQRPLEVHQIHYLAGTTIYSADPIIDKMSIQPKLAKLPMMKNIVVEGGYVDHVNANQSDYAKFLRFHCCENVDVRSITSTRNMTGSIEFYHSANVVVRNCHLAGSKKADLIYAVVPGAVNGMQVINNQFEGFRHAFTTAGSYTRAVARIHTVDNGTALTCEANGTTNILTTNANHEFQVNDVIRFYKKEGLPVTGSVTDFNSDGASAGTYYIKTVESANSFTMSTTVGGAAVDVATVTTPRATIATVRWGTPLNVLVADNVATTPVKYEVSASTGSNPFGTHVEGYGITFQGNAINLVVPNNGAESSAFDIRCRAARVLNNTVIGSFGTPVTSFTNQVHHGVNVAGNDCIIANNTFENLGNPIYISTVFDDAVYPAAAAYCHGRRAIIQGNVFRRCNYVVIWVSNLVAGSALGRDLLFQTNVVKDCALYNASGTAMFIIPDGCINTRWTGNYINKPYSGNDLFSLGNALTSSDIAFAGNTFDGWGADIGSDEGTGTNWATVASTWTAKNTFI